MGCDSTSIPGAILCSRGRRSRKTCSECTRLATKMCDFPIERAGRVRTCDRDLCDVHAISQGEDRDYCTFHDTQAKESARAGV